MVLNVQLMHMEMHMEIGHFGEQQTLVEICKQYYWHNKTEQVRAIVRLVRNVN